jgi:hypothetical protein
MNVFSNLDEVKQALRSGKMIMADGWGRILLRERAGMFEFKNNDRWLPIASSRVDQLLSESTLSVIENP